jgi:RNA-directed DNA polymerase
MPLRPKLQRSDDELRSSFEKMRSFADVADLLEVPAPYLKRLLGLRRQREFYRQFAIAKRSGGVRTIDAPPIALRILQQKLNYILQLVHRPKPSVHGFVQQRSIVTNASTHVHRPWILNVDLEDFFPSIHLGRVLGAMMAKPFSLPRYVATVLAQICTKADGVLPQGAPTSPFVSNIVCARLDGQLMALAKRHRLTYTRYCDDITLSTRQSQFPAAVACFLTGWTGSDVAVGDELQQVIASNGFRLNASKTRLQFRTGHQEVTGITVNQFPNLQRSYIKSIRGILHAWKRHGKTLAAQEFARRTGRRFSDQNLLEAHFGSAVRGRIEYVAYVRGKEDPIYCRLRSDLSRLEPTLISSKEATERFRALPFAVNGDHWARLYDRRKSSIGLLEVVDAAGTKSMGTAFAVRDGELVTAAHNLKGSVSVAVSAGMTLPIVSCKYHSLGRTLVDAAVSNVAHNFPPLLPDRRPALVGETVAVVGFASVPFRHPTLGIYTGTVESISFEYSRQIEFYQISVQASGGLSGSPVFDSQGRVLGLVVEATFERKDADVPGREFFTVLPIRYALEARESLTEEPIV